MPNYANTSGNRGKGQNNMAEFKPIETQEAFDAAIQERIKRAEDSVRKSFDGYISPDELKRQTEELTKQITDLGNSLDAEKNKGNELTATINDLTSKVKDYETRSVKSRIVASMGLPLEVADRINGTTEDEIKKDAEALKSLFGRPTPPPLHTGDTGSAGTDTRESALKGLSDKLARTNKGE